MNDPGALLQMTINLYDKGTHGNELIGVNKEYHLLQLLQKSNPNNDLSNGSPFSESLQLHFQSAKRSSSSPDEMLNIQLKFDLLITF
jgi:hypothetical protein